MQKAEFLRQNLQISEGHFFGVAAVRNKPRCSNSFPPALLPCQGSKYNYLYIELSMATRSVWSGMKKMEKYTKLFCKLQK